LSLEGMFAALAAALGWATATALFRNAGREISPHVLNLLKGLLASSVMLLVLLLRSDEIELPAGGPFSILLLSGLIGIGIGDTAYFTALKSLGVRRVLLMELLAVPFATLIALVALGEQLSGLELAGILIVLSGVSLVVARGLGERQGMPAVSTAGIMAGALAAACQGGGVVLARGAMVSANLDPLLAALIRLSGGSMLLVLILLLRGSSSVSVRTGLQKVWKALIGATLLGTFLGIWLQQIALKELPAGLAQTLLSTSPLFALVLAALSGRRSGLLAWSGAIIALVGILLLSGLLGGHL
jgi:drug/metabolite transporter (DMT)-like permease